MITRLGFSTALVAAAVVLSAQAQSPDFEARSALAAAGPIPDPGADPAAAIALVAQGNGQATACSSCHGAHGEGQAEGGVPRLSGQSASYLYSALKAYASGTRPNQVMTPIAQALSAAEMRDAAAYYGAVSAPLRHAQRSTDADALRLATVGDAGRGLQSCGNCHGPHGAGLAPDVPRLANQFPDYLSDQLRAYQAAKRRDDPFGVMRDVAKRLDDQTISALAAYYAGLAPPEQSPATRLQPLTLSGQVSP